MHFIIGAFWLFPALFCIDISILWLLETKPPDSHVDPAGKLWSLSPNHLFHHLINVAAQ